MEKRAPVTITKESNKATMAESGSRKKTMECSRQDRQCVCAAPAHGIEAVPAASSDVLSEVVLGQQELIQEAILEDVDFVEVILPPETRGVIGNVSNLKHRILAQL